MKFDNQLRYAANIIATYKGEIPLHTWLKGFFRENPRMGSSDRRVVRTLVYGHYRLGHALRQLPVEKRILAALFLCSGQPVDLLEYFQPAWNQRTALPIADKIGFLRDQPDAAGFRITDIFPWETELSPGIDHETFCLSFLDQPGLFLRIRPGYDKAVRQKLDPALKTAFIPPYTLRLPNGFNVADHFTPDREVVIQDFSSQRIAAFFPAAPPASCWDACAASGGKTILAHDLFPAMELTVSDIRASILHNLDRRFRQAGIKNYHSFVIDLTRQPAPEKAAGAQLILADAPCTGSGTWGRTPEELWFFNPEEILRYSDTQKKILQNIAPRLAPGAILIYSTCSVFKKENEEIAAFLRENYVLEQDKMENVKGYDQHADTLFAARFRRP